MSVDLATFLAMVSKLAPSIVPAADAEDTEDGATHIPMAVTDARRADQIVSLTKTGEKKDWYWTLPGGQKVYHG